MPIISAQPFPNVGRVLVLTDWADVPLSNCVQVARVRVDTGEESPLRPYVYPCSEFGEFMHTSDGKAFFWDTEAPLDTSIFYRSRSAEYVFPDGDIFDSFSRTVVDDWGLSSSLHTWTRSGGAAADYAVAAGTGRHVQASVNVTRRTVIGSNITDFSMRFLFTMPVVAATAAINVGPMWRYQDTNNHYRLNIAFQTDNSVDLTITDVTGGAGTNLGTQNDVATYLAGDRFWVRVDALSGTFSAKVWKVGTTEPAAFQLVASDSPLSFPAGQVGARTILTAGNTNTLPFNIEFDSFSLVPLGQVVETGPLVLPSDGGFWLRDPVRPCNDRRVELCYAPHPACLPSPGIFFVEMGAETFPNPGGVASPTNARRPIPIVRQLQDADTGLTLATRMFTDRDALLATLIPGSPLLFSGPPDYGIPDRYMRVHSLDRGRFQRDHRYEPRMHQLPYTTVDRPVGTTQGVCGSRFTDLCDVYPTWDAIEAAGLDSMDLILGLAGGEFDPDWKTYAEYDADFGTYADSTATGLTYQQLLEGDY